MDKKTKRLHFRLTEKEYMELLAYAYKKYQVITIQDFMRILVDKEKKENML